MVTLKDIANACGVSTATVSYVVNGGPRSVLPATRAKVLRAVSEFGYYPNAAARGLMGKRTHTFGVVFPHVVGSPFDNQYFATVLAGIIDASTERKQVAMLMTGMSWEEAERSIPRFCDGRCDGFLFLAPPPKSQLVETLLTQNKPLVLLGTRALGSNVSTVDVDNVTGSRLLTEHLLGLGHRKIGFLRSNTPSSSIPERTTGFQIALAGAGIDPESAPIFTFDGSKDWAYSEGSAYDTALHLLQSPVGRSLTAIVCTHDSTAILLIEAASKLGIRIPEDLSVVGFDDLPIAETSKPPLTTARQPLRQIGDHAASMLFELIESESPSGGEKLFDVQLIERRSTAGPRQAQ